MPYVVVCRMLFFLILSQANPGVDIDGLLERANEGVPTSMSIEGPSGKMFPELRLPGPPAPGASSLDPNPDGSQTPEAEAEAEDLSHIQLAEHLSQISTADERFFGASRYQC